MIGGKIFLMNGIKEIKAGNNLTPSIFNTFILALKTIFFNEKSFYIILLDNRITLNLVSIFFLMFAIPYKDLLSGKIIFGPGKVIEGMMITFIYIGILYLFTLSKKIKFSAFLRLFLAIETVDLFSLPTLFMSGKLLSISTALILAWYLSLSIIIMSKLLSISRFRASVMVIFTFLFVNILPAFFS